MMMMIPVEPWFVFPLKYDVVDNGLIMQSMDGYGYCGFYAEQSRANHCPIRKRPFHLLDVGLSHSLDNPSLSNARYASLGPKQGFTCLHLHP